MEKVSYSFIKEEKLTSKRVIQQIFDTGSVLYSHPLKIYYRQNDCSSNRFLVTVPKRLHKKAVSRNLIKRRIREACRLNKDILKSSPFADIIVVYISSEIPEFKQINNKINNVLAKIKKGVAATVGNNPAAGHTSIPDSD